MIFLRRIFYFFIIIILFSFNFQNVSAYSATSAVTINISDSNLTQGETATVTFTFVERPFSFNLGDVVATGGTLSNLAVTGNPLVYTATLTPSISNSSANTVSVSMNPTFVTYGGVVAGAWNLAYDHAGSMWVTNYFSNDLSKVAYDGTVTNYSGTGSGPRGIAFDGTNMWTANVSGNNVTKIAPNGSMTSYGPITTPMDIAYDGINMWTVNNDSTISKITPGGVITTYSGIGSNSTGIAFDGTNMWTVSFGDNSVTKVAPNGSVTTYTGTGSLSFSISFDGTNIWTGNYGDNSVTKVTPTGTMTTYSGLQSAGYDITFDGANLWVASVLGVSKVTLAGQITNYTDSSMYGASGIAVNTDNGSIWTANYNHSTVSKVGFASGVSGSYDVNTVLRRGGGFPPPVFPKSISDKPLDFIINNNNKLTNSKTLNIDLNADLNNTNGYIISLDPEFKNESINPYQSNNIKFELPDNFGYYKIYLAYVSKTGNKSAVISHDVSYEKEKIVTKSKPTVKAKIKTPVNKVIKKK